jgi:hypothetical protein
LIAQLPQGPPWLFVPEHFLPSAMGELARWVSNVDGGVLRCYPQHLLQEILVGHDPS